MLGKGRGRKARGTGLKLGIVACGEDCGPPVLPVAKKSSSGVVRGLVDVSESIGLRSGNGPLQTLAQRGASPPDEIPGKFPGGGSECNNFANFFPIRQGEITPFLSVISLIMELFRKTNSCKWHLRRLGDKKCDSAKKPTPRGRRNAAPPAECALRGGPRGRDEQAGVHAVPGVLVPEVLLLRSTTMPGAVVPRGKSLFLLFSLLLVQLRKDSTTRS